MPQRVFVIGLDKFYAQLLQPIADRRDWEILPILDEDRFDGRGGYPVGEMLEVADRTWEERGPGEAIVAYRDFPECTLVPDLSSRFGLPGPRLDAVLKCEHKYWSRLEQRAVVPDHIPLFAVIDVFDDASLAKAPRQLPFPFWLKPIKSFASHLGFRIENADKLREAVATIRREMPRIADEFAGFVRRAEAPPVELRDLPNGACLAESLIGGWQCTVEGWVSNGEIGFLGVVDSHKRPGGSTLIRYQYPSQLPSEVIDRMLDICRRLIERIQLDHTAFNVELFWDEKADQVWLLEINNRFALHHVPLFDAVDGRTNFEAAIDVALGQHPGAWPTGQGTSPMAATCFLKSYENARVTAAPSPDDVPAIEKELGCQIELRVKPNDVLAEMNEQESYSFTLALAYIVGDDEADIDKKFDQLVHRLGIELEPVA